MRTHAISTEIHIIVYVGRAMTQSGRSTSFRRWQELVVTELAPAHHSRENSQRSLTTHRFTVTLFSRSSLSNTNTSEIGHRRSGTFLDYSVGKGREKYLQFVDRNLCEVGELIFVCVCAVHVCLKLCVNICEYVSICASKCANYWYILSYCIIY